ncbi:MAG: carboxypeptidase regulatory-like domain-containing protein [Acidobacteria bacterium]|nr:carboxypeptidase regulatory-like domain-containing protein [Acidobacteriota bacterium]
MFRKSFFGLIVLSAVVLAGAASALAQAEPLSGTVEMDKGGTKTPLAGATVQVYRTDIKAGGPVTKTDKNGIFQFAGVPIQGTFVLAVSAPGASPNYFPNIKAGMSKVLVVLSPGDGRVLTEDEVREAVAKDIKMGSTANVETAEQKKAKEDYDAKVKAQKEANDKATRVNEVINRIAKEGPEAMAAKNYDLAISKYEEGIAADPTFVGSAPVFYINRGTALRARGIDRYNTAKKAATTQEKIDGQIQAKKDFFDSADSYVKAWQVLKNAPPADITDKVNYEKNKVDSLNGARESFRVSVSAMQADKELIDLAKAWLPEYIAAESDAAKKLEANEMIADLYRVSGDFAGAVEAYRAVLATKPDYSDAMAGLGLSLFAQASAEVPENKAMEQEALNYLQKYTEVAPVASTDPPSVQELKVSVKQTVDYLKNEAKMAPQKLPSSGKKKP